MGKLHHLDVGCADATVIQTATATLLVDCHDIEKHAHLLPSNKRLRGVFITHQHHDHHSGLKFLRRKAFTIEWLIYSPYDRRYNDTSVTKEEWNEFNSHRDYFVNRGTQTRTPYRQDNFEKPFWVTDGIRIWMLGPARHIAKRDTRVLHDACLVFKTDLDSRKCLFTGDASDLNLDYVAANTSHFCDDILHASHHGSLDGASLTFVKKCNAMYTVISTQAGVYENVPHPTALRRYRENTGKKVYRTDQNGSIAWTF